MMNDKQAHRDSDARLGAVIGAISVVIVGFGVLLIAGKDSGGFLPNFGRCLGLFVLGVGNLIVLALNGLRWHFYGGTRALRFIVGLQLVVVLAYLIAIGPDVFHSVQDSIGDHEAQQIALAIQADDVDQLMRAESKCGNRCAFQLPLDEQLLYASKAGSIKAATKLIRMSAKVSILSEQGRPTEDLWTCEGLYLPGQDALAHAVARDNEAMMRLLLPVSDDGSRREALWLAATLNRLQTVQWLVQTDVPINIRGALLDENQTLLVAAASGAALDVGRWLIESQHMPVNALRNGPDLRTAESPAHALLQFMLEVRSAPRAETFLRLLVARGADIDDRSFDGETLLHRAVQYERKDEARLLLDVGAKPGLLDDSQRDNLRKLLAEPDVAPYSRQVDHDRREGCIEGAGPNGRSL